MQIETWKEKGQLKTINGMQIFCIDTGGSGIPLLFLHGFPTSSYDFHKSLDYFSEKRCIFHDHPGFGFSEKPVDYSYSLVEQADTALMLWQSMGIKEGHLITHDYGTSVATEILARRQRAYEPVKIHSLVLCNGSMHIELAKLRPIQRLLKHPVLGPLAGRLGNYLIFKRNMKKIWGDPGIIEEAELRNMWELMIRNEGRRVLPVISRYVDERYKFWNRWIGALQNLDIPTFVLWGLKDPIAVEAIALELEDEIRHSLYHPLPQTGHYPMLENPREWSNAILDFTSGIETKK